jgi:hypothetical protein
MSEIHSAGILEKAKDHAQLDFGLDPRTQSNSGTQNARDSSHWEIVDSTINFQRST